MRKKKRSRAFKENDQVIHFEEERQKRREKRLQTVEKKKGKPESAEKISARRATKLHRRRLIYGIIVLFIVAIIGFSIYNVVSLRIERAEIAAQKVALEKEKSKLEQVLKQVDSDEYVENEARGALRMIKPGETIYMLEDAESTEAAIKATGAAATDGGASSKEEPATRGSILDFFKR